MILTFTTPFSINNYILRIPKEALIALSPEAGTEYDYILRIFLPGCNHAENYYVTAAEAWRIDRLLREHQENNK